MTRIIYALSGFVVLLLTVLISVAITLTIVRADAAARSQNFVSVNMQELVFMLAEQAGGSDEAFASSVRDLGRSIDQAIAQFGDDNVVVFDADMILTGAPDVTPHIYQLLKEQGQ